jgi:geranyl-CoA carboxylase alpha subunit
VFGDRYGNGIHLGERDCSVQRRHQKLIEEAPSPAVTPDLRARMGEIAVKALKAIGYEGAGTLEFLLDSTGNFYFMEMNTRLQVEHPVTEAITGLDLVELQLRIAGGEPLTLRQEDVHFSGHAIEVRLCSEDARHGFMPQSGRMLEWQPAEHLRVEHALHSGIEIPPFYDSMIAKVIAHGATRGEARRRLIHGLEQTVAFGVTTNQEFLASCLRNDVFAKGGATTAFIGQHGNELLARSPVAGIANDVLAALLLYVTDPHAAPWRAGRSLATTFPMLMRFDIDGAACEIEIARTREGDYAIGSNGEGRRIAIAALETDTIRIKADGLTESVRYRRDDGHLYVLRDGAVLAVHDLTRAAPERAAAGGGDGKLRAALNGRVVAVLVKPGDGVKAGQPVATLEAMKMEHVHVAPVSGIIAELGVTEGEQITTGYVIAVIEPAKDETT